MQIVEALLLKIHYLEVIATFISSRELILTEQGCCMQRLMDISNDMDHESCTDALRNQVHSIQRSLECLLALDLL